jgi:TetR/AcrR family acrAB operon transcriptional repressor
MATRRAVRRQPEVSRGGILDAALACFTERGYHATSVDDIAARAGLSKGAIYWHFDGKRELFLALVDRVQEANDELARAVASAADWRAGLDELFARAPELIQRQLPLVRVSLEYIAQGGADRDLRDRAERKLDRWIEVVEVQLARGVAAGELRPVAAREVTLVIGAVISGLMLTKLAQPELDLAPTWRAAQEILWRGISA